MRIPTLGLQNLNKDVLPATHRVRSMLRSCITIVYVAGVAEMLTRAYTVWAIPTLSNNSTPLRNLSVKRQQNIVYAFVWREHKCKGSLYRRSQVIDQHVLVPAWLTQYKKAIWLGSLKIHHKDGTTQNKQKVLTHLLANEHLLSGVSNGGAIRENIDQSGELTFQLPRARDCSVQDTPGYFIR